MASRSINTQPLHARAETRGILVTAFAHAIETEFLRTSIQTHTVSLYPVIQRPTVYKAEA